MAEVIALEIRRDKIKPNGERKAKIFRSLDLKVRFLIEGKTLERTYNFPPYLNSAEISTYLEREETRLREIKPVADDDEALRAKATAVAHILKPPEPK